MNNLVFINRNDAFTTSDIIADYANVGYRSVQRLIEKHEKDISQFGRVRFEITPLQTRKE